MKFLKTSHIRTLVGWIILFFLISYLFSQRTDLSTVSNLLEQYPFWSPLIIILLKISTILIAPLSGGVLYALIGNILPFQEAVILLTLGNMCGSSIAYFLGKWYGEKVIHRAVKDQTADQITSLIEKLHAPKTYTITRIVLFPLEDILYILAGMSRLSYQWFLLISTIISTLQLLFILQGVQIMRSFF